MKKLLVISLVAVAVAAMVFAVAKTKADIVGVDKELMDECA